MGGEGLKRASVAILNANHPYRLEERYCGALATTTLSDAECVYVRWMAGSAIGNGQRLLDFGFNTDRKCRFR